MDEKDIKSVMAGIAMVITILKIMVQHRGQARKGANKCIKF